VPAAGRRPHAADSDDAGAHPAPWRATDHDAFVADGTPLDGTGISDTTSGTTVMYVTVDVRRVQTGRRRRGESRISAVTLTFPCARGWTDPPQGDTT
jgi:hypothetical protein